MVKVVLMELSFGSFVTLRKLLSEYGLRVNNTLQKMLDTHLVVLGEDTLSYKADDLQLMLHEIHHQVEFQQILHMKKSMTFKILVELYAELRSCVKPIMNYLDFLVYFYLHNCELFNKYLNHQISTLSASKSIVDSSTVEVIEGGQLSEGKVDEKFVQVCVQCNTGCVY